jgi:hypothetical protein
VRRGVLERVLENVVNGHDDPPVISVQELEVLGPQEVPEQAPGFIWFPADDAAPEAKH